MGTQHSLVSQIVTSDDIHLPDQALDTTDKIMPLNMSYLCYSIDPIKGTATWRGNNWINRITM